MSLASASKETALPIPTPRATKRPPAGSDALCRRVDRSDANQLFVHELLDAHAGELASVAGVLDAAERQVRCRPGRVIDEHHARVDAARHAFAARNILGEDRAPQPEFRVSGERHRLVLVLDSEEKRDRPEEFLPKGGIAGLDIR